MGDPGNGGHRARLLRGYNVAGDVDGPERRVRVDVWMPTRCPLRL